MLFFLLLLALIIIVGWLNVFKVKKKATNKKTVSSESEDTLIVM